MAKLKILIISFFILSGFFCFSQTSHAAMYYVSPNGTNTWPNCTSQSNPCPAGSTHKEFLGAVAGDMVYFLLGDYNPGSTPNYETPAWQPLNSGSSESARITFKCLSGTCNIQGNYTGPSIGATSRSYITWDGFTITMATDGGSPPSVSGGIGFRTSTYCIASNNHITGINQYPWMENSGCISVLAGSTDCHIYNNYLTGNVGNSPNVSGIFVHTSTRTLVEHNDIINCGSGIYDKNYGQYNIYRYNFIYTSVQPSGGGGIGVGAQTTSDIPHDISIYQNIIVDKRDTTEVGGIGTEGDYAKNIVSIYNNTIYFSAVYAHGGISTSYGAGVDNLSVFNNIVVNTRDTTGAKTGKTNTYWDYNNYYNGTRYGYGTWLTYSEWQEAGWDTHGVTSDPSFVNPGGTTAVDYKRTSYSTNGRGGSYSNVMGAYITGNETIGYTPSISPDTTPPAPPSGVTIS